MAGLASGAIGEEDHNRARSILVAFESPSYRSRSKLALNIQDDRSVQGKVRSALEIRCNASKASWGHNRWHMPPASAK